MELRLGSVAPVREVSSFQRVLCTCIGQMTASVCKILCRVNGYIIVKSQNYLNTQCVVLVCSPG